MLAKTYAESGAPAAMMSIACFAEDLGLRQEHASLIAASLVLNTERHGAILILLTRLVRRHAQAVVYALFALRAATI
jgi:hypothetical protein